VSQEELLPSDLQQKCKIFAQIYLKGSVKNYVGNPLAYVIWIRWKFEWFLEILSKQRMQYTEYTFNCLQIWEKVATGKPYAETTTCSQHKL
jgi:hypothetical protein